jgi:hypothetical protein
MKFSNKPYFKILIGGKELSEVDTSLQVSGSISFKHEKGKHPNVNIPFKNIDRSVIDHDSLQELQDVTLTFGVSGIWKKQFELRIGSISYEFADTISATLHCYSKAVGLVKKTGEVWHGKTSSEIARVIGTRLGYQKFDIVETTIKRDHVAQAYRSYADLLYDLSEDEGYVFGEENGTFYFRPVGYDESPSGELHYRYGIEGEILSFNLSVKSIGSMGAARGVRTTATDKDSGKQESAKGQDKAVPAKAVVTSLQFVKGGGFKAEDRIKEEPAVVRSPEKKEVVEKQATEEHRRALWRSVEANAKILDTLIEPNCTYRISGVGEKAGGVYLAKEVQWTLNVGQIIADVKFKRGGVGRKDPKKESPTKKSPDKNVSTTDPRVKVTYTKGGGHTVKE